MAHSCMLAIFFSVYVHFTLIYSLPYFVTSAAVLENICDIHVGYWRPPNSANMGAFRCLPFVSEVCLTSKGLTCERGNTLLKGLSKKGLGRGDVGRRECGPPLIATASLNCSVANLSEGEITDLLHLNLKYSIGLNLNK